MKPSLPRKTSPRTIDLGSRRWKLQGWRPFYWKARRSLETGGIFSPEFGPFVATVPGSVHDALKKSKVIPDWNMGLNSLACEWVEHRHWEFFMEIKAGEILPDAPVALHAEGLDYSGWILVDTNIVSTFSGALVRHKFDLTKFLRDGKSHRLSIIFDVPPEEQGQIGRTSLSRHFKPRYSFSWDWCVRMVPIGIWDRLSLVCGPSPVVVIGVTTKTADDLKSGEVIVRLQNKGKQTSRIELIVRSKKGGVIRRQASRFGKGMHTVRVSVRNPSLWWPNGNGMQNLYDVEVRELPNGHSLFRGAIGFKQVRWQPCEDAPEGARPLLCEINGRRIFLQGVNWTPARMDYPATPDSDYRRLIRLYQDMGCNVLRVWGGGFLEKEIFYRLCDEAGLLVWQEFPLSSSGIDNDAPRDSGAISALEEIATDYIRRRGHHASLLVWCGGNELQTVAVKSGVPSRPLDEAHPALAALKKIVARENPGVRFFPTSPSGPVFFAHRAEMGKGVHHHVHGPWDTASTEESWRDYWSHDDSLLRAETGVAGTASVGLIKRYAGNEKVWPPTVDNPLWRHSSAWWVQWKIFKKEVMKAPASTRLACYVALSQERQARFLAIAAQSCKDRFPKCAGFIVWMGHDAFPCPANTSIIDFDHHPKPAYHALRKVFHA